MLDRPIRAKMDSTSSHYQTGDRPIALRRERRASAIAVDYNVNKMSPMAPPAPSVCPKTPSNGKKRARVSEPLPQTRRINQSTSTGLTPALKKTKLNNAWSTSARRRRSGPAILNPNTAQLPAVDEPICLQFTPIRAILDPRIRRVLRRSGLSEAQNAIEADKRLMSEQEKRIKELQAELALVRADAEQATQIQRPSDSFSRAQEIEDEIRDVRASFSVEAPTLNHATAGDTPDYDDEPDFFITDDVQPRNLSADPPSPCPTDPFTDDEVDVPSPSSAHALAISRALASRDMSGDIDLSPAPPLISGSKPHSGAQTMLTSSHIERLETRIETQKEYLTQARMELEHILPGETSLGLYPPTDADPSPLIDALLAHFRDARSEIAVQQSSIERISRQEQNLRKQFNQSLQNVETARSQAKEIQKDLEKTSAVFRASRRQADDYYKQGKKAKQQLEASKQKIDELREDNTELQLSASRLSDALKKYCNEVTDYQRLILELEESHAKQIKELEADHLTAVKDLEAQIEAETLGRHELEQRVDDLTVQGKSHERQRAELREIVHAKQRLLREVEERLETAQTDRQKEVGALNARLATTQSRLHELEDLIQTEKHKARDAINNMVEDVRTAGQEAVREVIENTDGSFGLGLMTPDVDGGRFRDAFGTRSEHIDGTVEVRRGRGKKQKRRHYPDSGIGILEEDQEMLDVFSSDL